MALKVWLPLNKDFRNNGLSNVTVINSGCTLVDNGVFDKCCNITLGKYIGIDGPNVNNHKYSPISLSLWIYPTQNDTTSYEILGCWQNGGGGLFVRSNKILCSMYIGEEYIGLSSSTITINTWHHVCFTYDETIMRLYLDGQQVSTVNASGPIIYDSTCPWQIGGNPTSTSFSTGTFVGKINDVRIYDNCLTPEDVKHLYNCAVMDINATKYNDGFFYDNSGFLVNDLTSTGITFSGNSMYFDGTTSQIRPKTNGLGLNISGGTLSVWFTPLSAPSGYKIIYIDSVSHMAIGFLNSSSFICNCNGGSYNTYSTANIQYNQLNHMVIGYASNYEPQYCYINGIKAATGATNSWTENSGLTIGGRQYDTDNKFNGYISKVTVYKKQLTESEAVKLYLTEDKSVSEQFELNSQNTIPYLTFTSMQQNSSVQLNRIGNNTTLTNAVLQYSIDGGKNWSDYTFTQQGNSGYSGLTITLQNIGDSVKFKGVNTTFSSGSSNYHVFKMTGKISANGDITSLFNGYGGDFSIPSSGCVRMFRDCTSLTTAPKLPATTLADFCYYQMFYNCTSLTTVPELPSTTLASYCYNKMFQGCTSLTTAPELPATTLASYCYRSMFEGCTSLTTAPELPSTTLANNCYQSMFGNCISLTTAPELPATTLASACYYHMFDGCTSLTTAPELPATTLANYCYENMFNGCTSLTTAPELPATTLANYCYGEMFVGCASLTTAPELPATTLANNCYYYMFAGCTSLTTGPSSIGNSATTIAASACTNMFIGCTSLTTSPELPATTLANNCYRYMFQGCTSLITAPELPATTLKSSCYYHMFDGCTSLTTAPELPATTLVNGCYQYMFYGCSSLNYIKAMFTTTPSTDYTSNWVNGVSSNGTFITNSNATWYSYGINGIPKNWNVYDENGIEIIPNVGINYDNSLNIYHIIVDDFRDESGEGESITTEEYLNDIYFESDCYDNEYTCIGTFLYEGNTYYIWENVAGYGYLLTTDYEFSVEDTINYDHSNRNCVVYAYLDSDLDSVYDGQNLDESQYLLFDYWVDE